MHPPTEPSVVSLNTTMQDLDPRLSLQRSETASSEALRNQKTKTVNLRPPPCTKEYADDYCQYVKAPDPKVHFARVKCLLIDAANNNNNKD